MSYPKQELYQFSIVASHPDIEATIGPQVSAIDADTKTRKIGAAVFWPIEEGTIHTGIKNIRKSLGKQSRNGGQL